MSEVTAKSKLCSMGQAVIISHSMKTLTTHPPAMTTMATRDQVNKVLQLCKPLDSKPKSTLRLTGLTSSATDQ